MDNLAFLFIINSCRLLFFFGLLRDQIIWMKNNGLVVFFFIFILFGYFLGFPIIGHNTLLRKNVLKTIPESDKKGAFIGVGATKGKQLFDGSILTIKYFFQAFGVEYADELLVRGVDKRGEIKDHPDLLKEAFELGRRLAIR